MLGYFCQGRGTWRHDFSSCDIGVNQLYLQGSKHLSNRALAAADAAGKPTTNIVGLCKVEIYRDVGASW